MHSFWSTGIGTSAAPAVAVTEYRGGRNLLSAATVARGAGRERRAKIKTKE